MLVSIEAVTEEFSILKRNGISSSLKNSFIDAGSISDSNVPSLIVSKGISETLLFCGGNIS